jgi:hypothetical protein
MPDDQSAMIDHSVAMSPSEATSVLDGMIADLRSPVPLVPTNANEARQRLNALSSDASWVKKYLEGDLKIREEAESLNQLIANGSLDEALAGGPMETPEVTTGPDGLRRQDLLSAAADLRALWVDADDVERAISEVISPQTPLDPEFVDGIRAWKADLLSDPEFIAKWFNGDRLSTARMRLCDAVIAIAKESI